MHQLHTKPERKPMLVETLRLTPEYARLTTKQKLLVDTFIASGDRIFSTNTAYDHQSAEAGRMNSYRHFANARVVAVLNVWLKKTEKEIQLDIAEAQFKKAKAGSEPAFNFLNLITRLKKEIAEEESVHRVVPDDAQGDLIKDGVVVGYRDASGRDVYF
jgi:hypothetical protein